MPTLESRKLSIGLGLVGLVALVPAIAVAGATTFAALTGADLGVATAAATASALAGGLLVAWRGIARTFDALRAEIDEVRGAVQRLRDGDPHHELIPGEYTADLAVAVRELRGTVSNRQRRLEAENASLARRLHALEVARESAAARSIALPTPANSLMLAG